MVNRVTLIGRLGADPEVRRLDNGVAVARFSVATNESYKDNMGNWQDRTEWHNVVAWRLMAEKAENGLKKGSLVYVDGKISTRKWQDQNGNDLYSTDVVANYLRNVSGKEGGTSNNFPSATDDPLYAASGTSNTSPSPQSSAAPNTSTESEGTTSQTETTDAAADDDLPF